MKSYLSLFLATLFVGAASTESNLRGVVDERELINGNGPANAPDGTDDRAGGVITFAACLYDCVEMESALQDGAFTCADICMDVEPTITRKACMYDCVVEGTVTGSVAGFCSKFQASCPGADLPH